MPPAKPNASNASADGTPLRNSLRLSKSQLDHLFPDKSAGAKSSRVSRNFVRWPFRVETVEIRLIHPGGSHSTVIMAGRDLSAGGISLLHSTYIHAGSRCIVHLPRVDGEIAAIEGTIVRCSHLKGVIHEIGIKFNTSIKARDFVKLDPFADGFVLEKVDPEQLKGTILFIEESPLDQSLVRHFFRQTRLRLIIAVNKKEALAKAMEGVDLILCDNDAAAEDGAAIVAALRDAGISAPVIILTAETSEHTRAKLVQARANAFISKPIKQEMLFRAIAEFIVVDDSAGALYSSLPASHANHGLLDTFIQQLNSYGQQLDDAVAKDDFQRCRTLCLQISGSAPVMGFEKLAAMAQAGETMLSSTMSIQESLAAIRTLSAACKRVAMRTAA